MKIIFRLKLRKKRGSGSKPTSKKRVRNKETKWRTKHKHIKSNVIYLINHEITRKVEIARLRLYNTRWITKCNGAW